MPDQELALCIELHSRFGRTGAESLLRSLLNTTTTTTTDDLTLIADPWQLTSDPWQLTNDPWQLTNDTTLLHPDTDLSSDFESSMFLDEDTLGSGQQAEPFKVTTAGAVIRGGTVSAGYRPDWTLEMVKFFLGVVLNPALCVLGIVGNVFSVVVLTRRRMRAAMSCGMERSTHVGLIALAVSDTFYCLCTAAVSLLSRHQAVFTHMSVVLFIKVSSLGLQNTFARTSTWLTVILAAGRYLAVYRPLQLNLHPTARCSNSLHRLVCGVTSLCVTRAAVIATFLFWTALELPVYWTYTVHEYICPPDEHRYFFLDQGEFVLNGTAKTAFTYFSTILGFLLPFIALTYCNVHLIRALHISTRMRRSAATIASCGMIGKAPVGPSRTTTSYGSCVTPTLVSIVCMFLAFVTPAELLRFYYYAIGESSVEMFSVAIQLTNLLQTVNFALNFLIYSMVSVHFRLTCRRLMRCGRGGTGGGGGRPVDRGGVGEGGGGDSGGGGRTESYLPVHQRHRDNHRHRTTFNSVADISDNKRRSTQRMNSTQETALKHMPH